jgi:large subunit ribosomal protein L17
MRNLNSGRKLNRTASHRKAMLANLAQSILDKERVTTTVPKAKEVRSVVERLITYGKKGTLHAIRLAARYLSSKDVLKKLFNDIAPSFKAREGGYTRVVKLKNRKGDNAELAIIELVGREGDIQRKRKKKKKGSSKRIPSAKTTAGENETVAHEESQENNAVQGTDEAVVTENVQEVTESKSSPKPKAAKKKTVSAEKKPSAKKGPAVKEKKESKKTEKE